MFYSRFFSILASFSLAFFSLLRAFLSFLSFFFLSLSFFSGDKEFAASVSFCCYSNLSIFWPCLKSYSKFELGAWLDTEGGGVNIGGWIVMLAVSRIWSGRSLWHYETKPQHFPSSLNTGDPYAIHHSNDWAIRLHPSKTDRLVWIDGQTLILGNKLRLRVSFSPLRVFKNPWLREPNTRHGHVPWIRLTEFDRLDLLLF